MSDVVVSVDPSDAVLAAAQDQRRAHILAAARSCFARSGFHGASMQQICAEARMSPGALYRYFPSKDTIIEAIAEEERAAAGVCMAALEGKGGIVERITAVAMDYLRACLDPETGSLMVEICSESIRNTTVGKRFHEIDGDVRSAFREALRRAQEAGEVDPALDIETALTILFAIGDGLVMRLRLESALEVETIEPYLRRILGGLFQPLRAP